MQNPSQTAQRSDRATEVRAERRRKPGSVAHSGLKLHVDQEHQDSQYTYRWVNDVPGRIQQFESQDWDKVSNEAIAQAGGVGGGTIPTRYVGSVGAGPTNAVLMRKRKDWHEEDRKAHFARIDEMDKTIRNGTEQKDTDLAGAYTPNGSNSISRE